MKFTWKVRSGVVAVQEWITQSAAHDVQSSPFSRKPLPQTDNGVNVGVGGADVAVGVDVADEVGVGEGVALASGVFVSVGVLVGDLPGQQRVGAVPRCDHT